VILQVGQAVTHHPGKYKVVSITEDPQNYPLTTFCDSKPVVPGRLVTLRVGHQMCHPVTRHPGACHNSNPISIIYDDDDDDDDDILTQFLNDNRHARPSSMPSDIPSQYPSALPSSTPSANPSQGCENTRTDVSALRANLSISTPQPHPQCCLLVTCSVATEYSIHGR
jgi:hypothetical protein